MAKRCRLSGKRPLTGNNVSHANNKTKRRQFPNLQHKRLWVPELQKHVRVRVSTSALRSIDKMGLGRYLTKNGLRLADIT